jgi:hypothetical protein
MILSNGAVQTEELKHLVMDAEDAIVQLMSTLYLTISWVGISRILGFRKQ